MAHPPATQDQALAILQIELNTPTFGFTYIDGTTQDDGDSAGSLNTRDQTTGKQALTPTELAREVTLADYTVAEPIEREWYNGIMAGGSDTDPLPITNGSEVALGLVVMFPGGSDTRNNLLSVSQPATRFQKLLDNSSFTGVLQNNGTINDASDINGARVRMGWDYTP